MVQGQFTGTIYLKIGDLTIEVSGGSGLRQPTNGEWTWSLDGQLTGEYDVQDGAQVEVRCGAPDGRMAHAVLQLGGEHWRDSGLSKQDFHLVGQGHPPFGSPPPPDRSAEEWAQAQPVEVRGEQPSDHRDVSAQRVVPNLNTDDVRVGIEAVDGICRQILDDPDATSAQRGVAEMVQHGLDVLREYAAHEDDEAAVRAVLSSLRTWATALQDSTYWKLSQLGLKLYGLYEAVTTAGQSG